MDDYRFPSPPAGETAAVDPKESLTAVAVCPFCASKQVATTNKTLTPSTYWRCLACGEIWNPRRAQVAAPFRRRW